MVYKYPVKREYIDDGISGVGTETQHRGFQRRNWVWWDDGLKPTAHPDKPSRKPRMKFLIGVVIQPRKPGASPTGGS